MNPYLGWPLLCGASFGLACYALARALHGVDPAAVAQPSRLRRGARAWWRRRRHPGRRATAAAVTGIAGVALTGWPVALPIGAVAAWTLPDLLGRGDQEKEQIARIEALAGWAEQLRDTLSAASGLQQALQATATTAPVEIRPDVAALAERLAGGQRLPAALQAFGHDLDDPLADLVVVALVGASRRQTGRLADLLTALASSTRAHALMRTRTVAARARVRTSVRVTVGATLALAGGLFVLNRHYLDPYGTPTGQVAVTVVAALFATAFWWLARISAFPDPPRLLAPRSPDPTDPVGRTAAADKSTYAREAAS
ncbi:type II secretion system F family protein [Streptacidiphilus albus]|uniref:type II secretion system F family protein n=1 Tax=Streptacidiphilus albus TaxID=105425 RepID=UPI00068BFBD4|nr:type II secretion system F family protein [Streptacidiphilus albus]